MFKRSLNVRGDSTRVWPTEAEKMRKSGCWEQTIPTR